jgi:hypothetical protein
MKFGMRCAHKLTTNRLGLTLTDELKMQSFESDE